MARARGRGRGGSGGGSGGGASRLNVDAVQRGLDDFASKVNDATLGVGGLVKGFVEGSDEFKRAKEGFEATKSASIFPIAQNLAAEYMPSALPGIQGLRQGLGQISAEGGTLARLQGLGEQAAEMGMPLSKADMGELVGPILEQEKMKNQARNDAADVMHNTMGGDLVTSGVKELIREGAQMIAEEIRKLLPGGGPR